MVRLTGDGMDMEILKWVGGISSVLLAIAVWRSNWIYDALKKKFSRKHPYGWDKEAKHGQEG